MAKDDEGEFSQAPADTDFHGKKRELLKRGVDQGYLEWETIKRDLAYAWGQAEVDVFLFTCDQMGIKIRNKP